MFFYARIKEEEEEEVKLGNKKFQKIKKDFIYNICLQSAYL